MPEDIFDAVVVGAGPCGTACALISAKGGANVALMERGEYPGAKNVQGAVMYTKMLADVIPEFWKDPTCPIERRVMEQRMVLTHGAQDWTSFSYRSEKFREPPNCFTVLRSKFDQWFAAQAEKAGANLFSGVTISEIMRANGSISGVKTSEGEELASKMIVACDGVNSIIAQKLGIIDEWRMDEVAMGVKEVLSLPKEKIEDRFNVEGDEGVTIELFGGITQNMLGYAFVYTNKETLSIGVGCKLSDLRRNLIKPYDLLDFAKKHPMISRLIKGAKPVEYSAHLIPEGGFNSMPPLYGNGYLIGGDAAQMINPTHREGSNLAMASGRYAGETILEAKKRGDYSSATLSLYEKKVKGGFIWSDLWGIRDLESNIEKDHSVFEVYPRLINEAMYHHFTVDGRTKKEHKKETIKMFLKERGLLKMMRDAWRLKSAVA
ncbi:MAG: FAD-dependent monooxygenase [Elusimicrobiota bacterium]